MEDLFLQSMSPNLQHHALMIWKCRFQSSEHRLDSANMVFEKITVLMPKPRSWRLQGRIKRICKTKSICSIWMKRQWNYVIGWVLYVNQLILRLIELRPWARSQQHQHLDSTNPSLFESANNMGSFPLSKYMWCTARYWQSQDGYFLCLYL